MQGVQVQSLVTELRSHIFYGAKKPKPKKEKQYCNKFNKDFLKNNKIKIEIKNAWNTEEKFRSEQIFRFN